MKRLWMIIALPMECVTSLAKGSGLQVKKTAKRLWGELAPKNKP